MDQSNVLKMPETNEALAVAPSTENLLLDVAAMNHMMNVANFMAGGTLTLPEPYRKNPANCLAVIMQAAQWKMNPFAVAQKTHFVNGTIGYEAQLVAAAINQSGATKDNFHFEWYGSWEKVLGKFITKESQKKDDYGNAKKYKVTAWDAKDEEGLGIKVWATLRGESEPRVLDLLLTQANTRNSTLWADDPRQQLAYLAQKRWARLYAPGVILGVYTIDEAEEFGVAEKDVTPQSQTGAQAAETNKNKPVDQTKEREALMATLKVAAEKGVAAYQKAWESLDNAQRLLIGTKSHQEFKKTATTADQTVDAQVVEPTTSSAAVDEFAAAYEQAEQNNA